jgi:hypothetical protein
MDQPGPSAPASIAELVARLPADDEYASRLRDFELRLHGWQTNVARRSIPLVQVAVITDYISQGSTIKTGAICDSAPPPSGVAKFQSIYIPASRVDGSSSFALLRKFPLSVLQSLQPDPDILAEQARIASLHNHTLARAAPHLLPRWSIQEAQEAQA